MNAAQMPVFGCGEAWIGPLRRLVVKHRMFGMSGFYWRTGSRIWFLGWQLDHCDVTRHKTHFRKWEQFGRCVLEKQIFLHTKAGADIVTRFWVSFVVPIPAIQFQELSCSLCCNQVNDPSQRPRSKAIQQAYATEENLVKICLLTMEQLLCL